MIDLERSKQNKWIFQKNTSSTKLIESYLTVLNETKDINKEMIIEQLKIMDAYNGRSTEGSLSTMGVRFSQMCFYMFGYKNNSNTFIPSQTTINILQENNSKNKNMLVNLFSIQYPHPYSKTSSDISIYAGRLIIKLLREKELNYKLYIDEMIYFLPFINKCDDIIYIDLINSIKEYRTLSYENKLDLFKKDNNWESLYANCLHEFLYYFCKIFKGFDVIDLISDINHNEGKVFSFRHGDSEKHDTYRKDIVSKEYNCSGFIKLNEKLIVDADNLLQNYSPFNKPISLSDENIFSKEDWIHDLYEVELLKYLSVVFPEYNVQRDIINSIAEMQYMSKYSSVDGKDFEISLKPVIELFRENLNVEIISGSGDTDLLCVFDDSLRDNSDYKINIEAKSRNSANNMNVMRIKRHLELHSSKYCIIVAPRFSRGNDLDISNMNMVSLTADSLGKYCSKECLSSHDGKSDYNEINMLIENNLGKNISSLVDSIVERKYGF